MFFFGNLRYVDVRNYEYNEFYNLSLIKGAQSEDYFAKVPVTFESNRGDIHVIFSETVETTNTNRAYEFRKTNTYYFSEMNNVTSNFLNIIVLGGYVNTLFEIRRKDYLYEKRNFNENICGLWCPNLQ